MEKMNIVSVNGTKQLRLNIQFFAAGQTGQANLVNPQVMGDMISAELPAALKLLPIADVDYSLQGRPGDTLTIPVWGYIGPAVDVAEFGAIPLEQLSTSTTSVTIKKAGKGVEISDEAVLRRMGDPIGEGTKQLRMSIADKMNADALAALRTASIVAGSGTTALDIAVDTALVVFNDEDEPGQMVLLTSPKGYAQLRKAEGFERGTALSDQVTVTGRVGQYLGATVATSRLINDGESYLIKPGALGIMMKRAVDVESDRDILHKTTIVTADAHYGAYLKDNTKVVKITHSTTA